MTINLHLLLCSVHRQILLETFALGCDGVRETKFTLPL